MANRNFPSGGKIYSGHVMPVLLDCQFTVAAADSAGLGITGLKGPFIQNVFMHTSTTPGAGNSNPATPAIVITNPNPASGVIVVQLQDNYNKYLGGNFQCVTPLGTAVSVNGTNLTAGIPYVITDVTSTPIATRANWTSLGVPVGVTPAVGVSFIAAATGAGTSAAMVAPAATNGANIDAIELVGNMNANPGNQMSPLLSSGQGFGAELIFRCMNSSGNAQILATPVAGSVIQMQFLLSNSSVLVQGE